MTQIELQELLLELWNNEVDVKFVMWKLNNDPSASNNGNAIVSGSWSIGRKVEVTECFHGHDFEIGEIVEIIEHEPRDTASWLCTNGKDNWWLSESEGNCR